MANIDVDDTSDAVDGSETLNVADTIERVGVDDLAFAAREMGIKRLVVVTPFGDPASAQTVLMLARRLTENNHPVALLQLDAQAASPLDEGDSDGAGWIDLLGGARSVGEIVHRDPETSLHVSPSGQIDMQALEDEQLEDLSVYLQAFVEAYAITVLHAPAETLARIEGLNDGETALIITADKTMSEAVDELAEEMNAVSNYDVLHLVSEGDARILH